MLESPLVENANNSFSGRLQRLKRRFFMGDADPEAQYSHHFSTTFQQHAGPITDAIKDASSVRKGLMVFLYSTEHVLLKNAIKVLNSPDLANEIRRNFVFIPLCVTTPEGMEVANSIKFAKLPLLALYKPKGNNLDQSQLYVNFAGKIDSEEVISASRTMMTTNRSVAQEQDLEYEHAVREAQTRAEEEAERLRKEAENEDLTQKAVDDAFNLIPDIESGSNTITIKFLFDNGQVSVKIFNKDAPLSQIYAYARKYQHPDQFNLIYGYPPVILSDMDAPICSEVSDRQAILHVDPL